MKIDGNLIASEIKEKLKEKVTALRQKNILPHLAIILIGHDSSSLVYIRRKKIFAKEIGVKTSIFNFQFSIFKNDLTTLIKKLNQNKSVHGIIIQRPVPLKIDKEELNKLVIPQKDVDGFHPKSPFIPPVASAVLRILRWIFKDASGVLQSESSESKELKKNFVFWLKKKKILIIGRGETAGKPIAKAFQKIKIPFMVAHSQTKNLKKLCLSSDIIISCVGKPNIVRHNMITKKTILIGVGLHPEDNKLVTDYNQEEIAKKAAFYTPVPGGVGPVNVACLFHNLLQAVNL